MGVFPCARRAFTPLSRYTFPPAGASAAGSPVGWRGAQLSKLKTGHLPKNASFSWLEGRRPRKG
eukprot:scaffold13900_cov93-Isochrysis_galbana.AAC.4